MAPKISGRAKISNDLLDRLGRTQPIRVMEKSRKWPITITVLSVAFIISAAGAAELGSTAFLVAFGLLGIGGIIPAAILWIWWSD